jgi:FkbM family methyltransferase
MNPELVFDVGLHKGEDSELYLKKGFKVVAVEADPGLCAAAEIRLRQYIASGQLTIVNAAVAEKAGPLRFFKNEQISVWGTTSPRWADRNERLGKRSSVMTVEGVEFGQLLKEFGCPYYLKVDIEGSDLLCLHALTEIDTKPVHVSIESNKVSWRELLHEFELLTSLGYSKFKVVDQTKVKSPSI